MAPFAHAREYFDLFPTAKGISMGGAMTAIADDHNSIHYNAAGLALVQNWQFRFPDLSGYASKDVIDIKNQISDSKKNASTPIAKVFNKYDGKSVGLGARIGAEYVRPRLGIAMNVMSTNSVRIRTPSILFLKANVRSTQDAGVAVAYGHPFFRNHLRAGITLRPFIMRLGTDRILENRTLTEFADPKAIAGFGWGSDVDFGLQGNVDAMSFLGADWKPLFGASWQNTFATKFTNRLERDTFTGEAPPLERRLNVGAAIRVESLRTVVPTLSVELKDLGIRTDKWYEHLVAGLEVSIRTQKWFSTALRGHFARGNLGGGLGVFLGPAEIELGSYAVNLGRGPGIGVDRRYYGQLALAF